MENQTVIDFIRERLKVLLTQCTEQQQQMFVRMYSPKNLSKSAIEAIDYVPVDGLEWALTQVENTVRANKGNKREELL